MMRKAGYFIFGSLTVRGSKHRDCKNAHATFLFEDTESKLPDFLKALHSEAA